MSTPPPLPPPTADRQAGRAKFILWLSVLVFLSVNAALLFKACSNAPATAIQQAGSALERVAAAFHRGTITTSLISYATTLTNDLKLQVATLKQTEIFTRKEEAATAFGYLPLPDVIVEARVPVEYTYLVDLRGPWKIEVVDRRVRVLAPPLQFNTPAMDVSGMTLEIRKGMFKVGDVQENLRKSLASMAASQAGKNLPLVRENARRQVAQFIETWLLRNFTDGRDYVVTVQFSDEAEAPLPDAPLKLKR
jgi:hypothetical protein